MSVLCFNHILLYYQLLVTMSSDESNRHKRVVNRNIDTNEENVSRGVSQEVSPERPQNITFLNLHLGDLSMATNIVNIDKLIERTQRTEADLKELFTEKDLEVYRTVTNRIRKTIAIEFGIPSAQLYISNST